MLIKINNLTRFSNINSRLYSIKKAEKQSINYKNTINLPKTNFPQRLGPPKRQDIERSLVEGCFKDLYKYQAINNKTTEYVLHDGPPYANGDLHMGHAVNKILKDITLRKHIINSRKVHFVPGWDCHGLPIELKATTGKKDQDPLQIREKSLNYAAQTMAQQKKEFASWGIVANWCNPNETYRTNDSYYIQHQLQMFLNFFKKGLVYRALKPVYWSPSSGTALAEAELEYDPNFVSPSLIVRFELRNLPKSIAIHKTMKNVFCLIWTTTPWTLPSNQAVCYNPQLKYAIVRLNENNENLYLIASKLVEDFEETTKIQCDIVDEIEGEKLSEATYFHPIDKKIMPFLPADHVQETKGTGLVHTAPAHGPEDFIMSLKHKIPIKCLINENGKYTDEAPSFLRDKSVPDEGDNLVLNFLKNDVIYSGKISHSYPIDWRTKKPVIIRASEQWFIDTEKLKGRAINEIEKVQIYPQSHSDVSKNLMIKQLQKRPYWCISRQRSWGVPIPVFYKKSTREIIINEKIINHICSMLVKKGNMNFWWRDSVKQLIPIELLKELSLNEDDIEKGKDIFDIWFDSGISWTAVLKDDKVADLYLEGYDQFTGWFQSSLLTSVAFRNSAPYRSIFVHGFTVDEKGRKMSKSLGNVISPKDIIKKYGRDALRWWVASHATQHTSIIVSHNLLQGSSESLSKIRNTLKYFNGIIGEKHKYIYAFDYNQLSFLDKYILNEICNFVEEAENLYKSFEYNRVTALVVNFCTNQISSSYLHLIKDRLYCGTLEEFNLSKNVMKECYYNLCKILWPIAPFLVEESWSYHDREPFYKTSVKIHSEWKDPKLGRIFEIISDIRYILHKKAKDINTWTLKCNVQCSKEILDILKEIYQKNSSELCEILQVFNVQFTRITKNEGLDVSLETIDSSLCPRCRRYPVDIEDSVCKRCEAVLITKGFLQ